ncbi:MAG: type II secretion system major pseudopilin GspG [Planctomycetota bacterium]|jgi:general secretion pathway protein G
MKRRANTAAFTLVEIMVVVVILGILATVVTIKVTQYLSKARVRTARVQLQEIMKALALYKMEHKSYPESLDELVEKTEEHPDGLMDAVPLDPWGNAFEYVNDTEHGFDLVCYGADGQEGGEGDDLDLNSWELAGTTVSEDGEERTSSSSDEGK